MARKISKNLEVSRKKVDSSKFLVLEKAIKLAQETSYVKFDASIDLALKLNLDTRQADQQLRGSIALPNGTGKTTKVLVATDDAESQKQAKEAKAETVVGASELQEILKKGVFNFDIIIADPKMMPTLGRFGKQLGPKGLMPNPKTGTVTTDFAKAVGEVKKGKANYRAEKNGIVHTSIGKVSMETNKLVENANAVLDKIKKLKPSSVKGQYIQTFSVSSTMGPSIKIEIEK